MSRRFFPPPDLAAMAARQQQRKFDDIELANRVMTASREALVAECETLGLDHADKSEGELRTGVLRYLRNLTELARG